MIDEAVIDDVRSEVAPDPRDAEELHDLLDQAVILRPLASLQPMFDRLVSDGRAMEAVRDQSGATERFWCATERRREVEALLGPARFVPDAPLPKAVASSGPLSVEDAIALAVKGQLELVGPAKEPELAISVGGISEGSVASALARIEARGAAMRLADGRWWSKRLVARAHARARDRSRRNVTAVTAADLMRFLLEWHHVAPGTQLRGVIGLAEVLGQLQGFEAPAGAWEQEILAPRVHAYSAQLLDELCAHGEVAWGRLDVIEDSLPRRQGAVPSPRHPRGARSPRRPRLAPRRGAGRPHDPFARTGIDRGDRRGAAGARRSVLLRSR